MQEPNSLTRREQQIMDLLFASPGLSVREVNTRLGADFSYSATRAALSRLVDKGTLRTSRQGAAFMFHPSTTANEAGSSALRRVIDTFFGGSALQSMNAMLGFSSEELTPEELDRLERMLETARQRTQTSTSNDSNK